MAREGREFELKYKWLYDLDQDKYTVTSPAKVFDRASQGEREVDVLVEYKDSEGVHRRIGVECRDRKSVVDVTGVEQLLQKKNDLGLDYLLIATTNKFTQGAINKAKYYGVIIEKAEMLNKESIEQCAKKFFADFFFFKIELNKFNVFTKYGEILRLKDYLKRKAVIEQSAILNHVNGEFYFSIDFNECLKKFKVEDFFENHSNSIEMSGRYEWINTQSPECFPDVFAIEWGVRAVPYKISLPIEESLSVFDGSNHKNKNYRARFGGENEYFETGYLDGKVYSELKIIPRKYFRFAGAHLELNTIFPEDLEVPKPDFDYIMENLVGEFDMTNLFEKESK